MEPLADLIAAGLPERHVWQGRPDEAALKTLPGVPAVLLFVDEHDTPVQLLTSQHLRRFAISRLSPPSEATKTSADSAEAAKGSADSTQTATPATQPASAASAAPAARGWRVDLAEVVRGVRWRAVACPFEARWWYYRLARALHPTEYRDMISFGPTWFLHVDWSRPRPEIRVTDRVWQSPGELVGPFSAHKEAQQALEVLWDLFDLCRYPDQVRRAPLGMRCAYAEMGRCDAPCDGGAPLPVYDARQRAAWAFARGQRAAWLDDAAVRMKAAALAQRYELAAQIKGQIEAARRWESAWGAELRTESTLHELLVLPATRRKAWKLFLFRQGRLTEGSVTADRKLLQEAPAWLEAEWGREPALVEDVVRTEQTWLWGRLLLCREAETLLRVGVAEAADRQGAARSLEEQRERLREKLKREGAEAEGASAETAETADSAEFMEGI